MKCLETAQLCLVSLCAGPVLALKAEREMKSSSRFLLLCVYVCEQFEIESSLRFRLFITHREINFGSLPEAGPAPIFIPSPSPRSVWCQHSTSHLSS